MLGDRPEDASLLARARTLESYFVLIVGSLRGTPTEIQPIKIVLALERGLPCRVGNSVISVQCHRGATAVVRCNIAIAYFSRGYTIPQLVRCDHSLRGGLA